MIYHNVGKCENCSGRGYLLDGVGSCLLCHGTGLEQKEPTELRRFNKRENSLAYFRTLEDKAHDDLLDVHESNHWEYPDVKRCQFCQERNEKEKQENENDLR